MTTAHQSAEHGALLAHRTDLRALVVSGPDRISWLMGMLSCDLSPVEHNQAVYGLVLDKQGKILADLVAMQFNERLVLAVDADQAESLQEHLDRFLIMEDAEIELLDEPHGLLLVIGPRSPDVVQAASQRQDVLAARTGRLLGTEAALILVRGNESADAGRALAQEDPTWGFVEQEAFDQLRLQLGLPRFGVEFGPNHYPMDAGLDEHAISFSK
ncbi:MAG: hypothetical protein ACOC1F_08760, partial [Myxococcota bacterium]